MNKKQIFFLIFLILPHLSFSDTYSVDDKFYFGFGAGVINPNDVDIDITVAETINGVAFSGNINGEFKFDVGYQVSTVLGYRLSDSLSIEGEFGYLNFDYDRINLTAGGTATSGGVTFTGSANTSYVIDGNIDSYSFVFGPNFDFDFSNKLEFLIGGGIGFSFYSDEIKSVGGSTGLSYDEDETDFTAKFKAGINYSMSEKSYAQLGYGFNFVNSGIDNFTDDFTAHNFDLKVIFNF